MKYSLGYITFPTKKEAKDTVIELLSAELIACANIIDGVESYFPWEEGIQKANEIVVICKTHSKNEQKIIQTVKEIHSYECPCIIFMPIEHGNPDYLKWIGKVC